jgi:hypothetical protein
MIYINAQGGSHGNYLEFVCNKIAGVATPGALPFNSLGASHNKMYCAPKVFCGLEHYGIHPELPSKVMAIQIAPDDLLPLNQVSILRAEDYGYDNNQLEIDTFNKLNNRHYRWVLDQLIDGFFADQISQSYDAVKDPSWPKVESMSDFAQLPEHIRSECLQQHGLVLLELTKAKPDCPRSVLREFFKIGFQDPDQHGFIARQKKATYNTHDVYFFPFACFYDKSKFLDQLKEVAAWARISYDCEDEIACLHDEFLARQPYKDSKNKCDDIVTKINHNQPTGVLDVTMLEEAYINAALGWDYFLGD